MLVLGIESTCDETAVAVVRDGREILSNVVSSQIELHRAYGGVVPELACRRHIDMIIPVLEEALETAKATLEEIDLIAVSQGPGLVGALLIGITAAKGLAWTLQKPLVAVNHIEGHLYAALMSHSEPVSFPCIGVVLSGGHTSIVLIKGVGEYQLIGQTVDDAIGEAFDKVAKLMGLPYPGGPEVELLAKTGNPDRFPFRAGRIKERPYDFSYSGLKTAVLYALKEEPEKCDLAASFQRAACQTVVEKVIKAAKEYGCTTVALGGGVTNNRYLRNLFAEADPSLQYLWPKCALTLDNAAMIAGLGYHTYQKKGPSSPLTMEPLTRIRW